MQASCSEGFRSRGGTTSGFASQSHFTEAFRRATGMTPRRYRETRGPAPRLPIGPPALRKPPDRIAWRGSLRRAGGRSRQSRTIPKDSGNRLRLLCGVTVQSHPFKETVVSTTLTGWRLSGAACAVLLLGVARAADAQQGKGKGKSGEDMAWAATVTGGTFWAEMGRLAVAAQVRRDPIIPETSERRIV